MKSVKYFSYLVYFIFYLFFFFQIWELDTTDNVTNAGLKDRPPSANVLRHQCILKERRMTLGYNYQYQTHELKTNIMRLTRIS